MDTAVARPMNLTEDPLFEYALLKLSADRFWWYQGYHHAVMDAFGSLLITRRVADVYTALAGGGTVGASPFGTLSDLITADHAYQTSEQYGQDRAYWTERFTDRPQPAGIVGTPSTTPERYLRHTTTLEPAEHTALRDAARRARAPWSHLVIAAAALHVHRTTGTDTVVLGLPVTARLTQVERRTPGTAANVLPLRLTLRPELTLGEFLAQIGKRVRELGEPPAVPGRGHPARPRTARPPGSVVPHRSSTSRPSTTRSPSPDCRPPRTTSPPAWWATSPSPWGPTRRRRAGLST